MSVSRSRDPPKIDRNSGLNEFVVEIWTGMWYTENERWILGGEAYEQAAIHV